MEVNEECGIPERERQGGVGTGSVSSRAGRCGISDRMVMRSRVRKVAIFPIFLNLELLFCEVFDCRG